MTLGLPSRPITEFEELVYMYASRLDLEGKESENWSIGTSLTFESATPATPAQNATQNTSENEKTASAKPAQVSYTLTITPNLCNHFDSLHGGSAATIIDILSTTILLATSRPGVFALGGVSRHLNLSYLRPAPLGSVVRVRCEVVQMGRRLALLRAGIERVDTGDVCVLAVHEKVNTDPEVSRV